MLSVHCTVCMTSRVEDDRLAVFTVSFRAVEMMMVGSPQNILFLHTCKFIVDAELFAQQAAHLKKKKTLILCFVKLCGSKVYCKRQYSSIWVELVRRLSVFSCILSFLLV